MTWPVLGDVTMRWREEVAAKGHREVYLAVRGGRLIREPCSVCGSPKSQAHHPDYSRPLDVLWLCQSHHHQQHCQQPPIWPPVPRKWAARLRKRFRQWAAEYRAANQPTQVGPNGHSFGPVSIWFETDPTWGYIEGMTTATQATETETSPRDALTHSLTAFRTYDELVTACLRDGYRPGLWPLPRHPAATAARARLAELLRADGCDPITK